MKEYSVKEIAEILKTNPETVRRWIRLGKLESVQQSRKGGNVITEANFNKFLKTNSKYAGIAAGTLGTLSILGITAAPLISAAVIGLLHGTIKANQIAISKFSAPEAKKLIISSINESKKSVKRKEEEINKLKQEIDEEMRKIKELQTALDEIETYENEESVKQKGDTNNGMGSE